MTTATLAAVQVDKPSSSDEQHRGLLAWMGRVVAWLMILSAVALLALMVVIPRVAGATPYTVLTGSMTPTYPPGTLVVIKPAAESELGVGVPITYQLESGRPEVVTHRIVEVRYGGQATTYITKGDANNVSDPQPVARVQIRGRVWYAVPVLGRLNTALNSGQHELLVVGVAGALAAYAGFMFASALVSRTRKRGVACDD